MASGSRSAADRGRQAHLSKTDLGRKATPPPTLQRKRSARPQDERGRVRVCRGMGSHEGVRRRLARSSPSAHRTRTGAPKPQALRRPDTSRTRSRGRGTGRPRPRSLGRLSRSTPAPPLRSVCAGTSSHAWCRRSLPGLGKPFRFTPLMENHRKSRSSLRCVSAAQLKTLAVTTLRPLSRPTTRCARSRRRSAERFSRSNPESLLEHEVVP